MELLNILHGAMETCGQPAVGNFQAELAPWNPADLAVDARILVWGVCPYFEGEYICEHVNPMHISSEHLYVKFLDVGSRQLCCYVGALFPCIIWVISLCPGI